MRWTLVREGREEYSRDVTAVATAQAPNCPYCDSPIRAGDRVHRCAACGTLHHADCWAENGNRCCVYSCSGRTQAAPVNQEVVPGVIEVADTGGYAQAPRGHDVLGEAVGFGVSIVIALLLVILVQLRGPVGESVPTGQDSWAPTTTAPAAARLVSVEVGDDRGEESHEVIHETREFEHHVGAIYVTAFVDDLPPGEQVRASMILVGGKKGAAKVEYIELGAAGSGGTLADQKRWFKFPRPGESWSVGKYEVRLATEDAPLGKVLVTVR